jgi:hypothetical protein
MNRESIYLNIEPHDVPEPESYDEKETYAFFGLASYSAQCLEKSLVNLAFTYNLSKKEILNIDEWDCLFENINKNTFGRLLNIIKDQFSISEIIIAELSMALKKRNWLAHDFFYDNAVKFSSEKGRKNMIAELSELIKLFNKNDQYIEQIYMHIWEQFGLTQETIDLEINKMKQGNA